MALPSRAAPPWPYHPTDALLGSCLSSELGTSSQCKEFSTKCSDFSGLMARSNIIISWKIKCCTITPKYRSNPPIKDLPPRSLWENYILHCISHLPSFSYTYVLPTDIHRTPVSKTRPLSPYQLTHDKVMQAWTSDIQAAARQEPTGGPVFILYSTQSSSCIYRYTVLIRDYYYIAIYT